MSMFLHYNQINSFNMSHFQGKWKVVSEENLDDLFAAFGK